MTHLICYLAGIATAFFVSAVVVFAALLNAWRRDEAEAAARARRIAEGEARSRVNDQAYGVRVATLNQNYLEQ